MNAELREFLRQLQEHGRTHDASEFEHPRKLLNLEADTAELVSILVRSSGAKRVLEIGTSNGYSTIWLAASIGPAGGRVITIDRNPQKQKMARENLSKVGLLQYVDLHCGDATEIVRTLPGPFEFVLFDADRKSAPAQLTLLLPKLAPKALVLADNVISHPAEIAGYLALLGTLHQFQHVVVPTGKGLSIAFTHAGT